MPKTDNRDEFVRTMLDLARENRIAYEELRTVMWEMIASNTRSGRTAHEEREHWLATRGVS
jgi:hypothetical protein